MAVNNILQVSPLDIPFSLTVVCSFTDQLRYWEHLPILPIVATLILTLTVFLLLIFQRNPSLVTGIVAAGLGTIALYLFLSSINDNRLSYE